MARSRRASGRPRAYAFTAASALYVFAGTIAAPEGAAQIQNPYGPMAPPPQDFASLSTPEGYPVLIKLNGSSYDVFVQISSSATAKYVKSSSAASD